MSVCCRSYMKSCVRVCVCIFINKLLFFHQKTFLNVVSAVLWKETTFQMLEVTLKQKRSFFTQKSLFSPFFGQKLVFWVKPTYILLPIDEEWKKVETNVFFPMKEESLLFLLVLLMFT